MLEIKYIHVQGHQSKSLGLEMSIIKIGVCQGLWWNSVIFQVGRWSLAKIGLLMAGNMTQNKMHHLPFSLAQVPALAAS